MFAVSSLLLVSHHYVVVSEALRALNSDPKFQTRLEGTLLARLRVARAPHCGRGKQAVNAFNA